MYRESLKDGIAGAERGTNGANSAGGGLGTTTMSGLDNKKSCVVQYSASGAQIVMTGDCVILTLEYSIHKRLMSYTRGMKVDFR